MSNTPETVAVSIPVPLLQVILEGNTKALEALEGGQTARRLAAILNIPLGLSPAEVKDIEVHLAAARVLDLNLRAALESLEPIVDEAPQDGNRVRDALDEVAKDPAKASAPPLTLVSRAFYLNRQGDVVELRSCHDPDSPKSRSAFGLRCPVPCFSYVSPRAPGRIFISFVNPSADGSFRAYDSQSETDPNDNPGPFDLVSFAPGYPKNS